MNDRLNEYIRTGSSDAFRHLVEEHVDAVYSQCLRQLGDAAWADDVTQMVFILLAQKANRISPNAVLEGWLFKATRYCCAHELRAAERRQSIEQKAARMRTEVISSSESDDPLPSDAERILDDAIAHLGERDRNAVLMRFFQRRSLREVGDAMGVSENAAKQRVFRAVEKLRAYFGARGLMAPSATVVAWLGLAVKPAGNHVVHAAVQGAAARRAADGSIKALRLFPRMRWSLLKIAAVCAVAVTATAAVVGVEYAASAQSPPEQSAGPVAHGVVPVFIDVEPTTRPLDQTTPLNALAKLCSGIQRNDRVAIGECLCDDGTDPTFASLARAFFDEEAGICHLEKTWRTRFGVPMAVPDFNLDLFPESGGFDLLLERLLDLPNGPSVQIDGQIARIRVDLPAEMFTGVGIHRIAALGRWSGATLTLRQLDGEWKLDTSRTLNLLAVVDRNPGNVEDAQVLEQKFAEDLANNLNAVAAKIDNGSISSTHQAIATMRTVVTRTLSKADIAGNIQFMALPVIGG